MQYTRIRHSTINVIAKSKEMIHKVPNGNGVSGEESAVRCAASEGTGEAHALHYVQEA